jgi:hypothetical protein
MALFSSGQSRFRLQPSNTFGGGRSSGITRTTIRPEYDRFLQEQRGLQLDTQRQVLSSQKQKQQLLDQLLGGSFGGGSGGGLFGNVGQVFQHEGSGGAGGGVASIPGLPQGYQSLLDRTVGDISRLGGARRQQIEQGSQSALNSALARLSDRGLGSSSLQANLATGAEQQKQMSLQELEDDLLGRQIGATQQIGGQGLQAQQSLIMQLLQSLLGA